MDIQFTMDIIIIVMDGCQNKGEDHHELIYVEI